jgi:hypothetical protein
MEREIEKKPAVLKTILYIFCSLLVAFMIYYAITVLLGPSRKISQINKEYIFQQTENNKLDERFFSDSAFIALNREKAYYQSRIILAESDSICLSLNLPDSTAQLEINGVSVHKSKMSEIYVSKVFRKADEYSVTSMLSAPLTIRNDYSTIMKEPVMIKMAPKDTSEYKPDILPDTTNTESVNYMFEMENGIRLYIYQAADENERRGLRPFFFDLNDRLRNVRDNLKAIISFKIPDYHPTIRLRMKKADARIIYRALPKHGQIAIYR